MFVREVRAMFDSICDEKDTTFLTVAQRREYLGRGYLEFRRLVANSDPFFYGITVDIAVNNAAEYDLALATNAVRIYGNPAGGLTGPRMRRAHKLGSIDQSGNFVGWVQQVSIIEDVTPAWTLWGTTATWCPSAWMLMASTLRFDIRVTGTLRLYYDPYPSVDWSLDAVTDDTFIDDLDEFHDLIPFLGLRLYQARDGVMNEAADAFISQRYSQLTDFLSRTRQIDSGQFVRQVY
jgi:hypothetical protein